LWSGTPGVEFAPMELVHHRSGVGEPLVLIHGLGLRWQVWEPVLPRVTAEREVIALDLPGFGASLMPPPGTPAGVASLTRLVGEFLDELGLDRPHLAGNSLGGWISLELAKQGRARSATGLSPAGFHTALEGRFQRTSLWLTARTAGVLARRADRLMKPKLARVLAFGQYVARPTRIPPDDAAAILRGLAGAPWFDETLRAISAPAPFSGGEQIAVPVTIAWGQHDRLLLRHQARRAQRAIPGARVLTLQGCGHVPTYDDPEQVARVLLEGSAAA
jgi:pimeloyl-ACP methyl ester carboxylesterase